jgi:hypothetical protein
MFRCTFLPTFSFASWVIVTLVWLSSSDCSAAIQKPTSRKAQSDGAIIKGQIEFDKNRLKSWKGDDLVVPFAELQTQLFQQVELPPPPLPANWKEMKPEEQQVWAKEFEASDTGKTFFTEQQKRIEAAKDFDVLIEKDGKFVVYDVPPGEYDLRGRALKEINGTVFGFEIYGQIVVAAELDEIRLPPLQIEITPLLKSGEAAPPIEVETHDGKNRIRHHDFQGNYLLMSFWISNAPSAEYQTSIQEAFAKIKDRYPIRLLSVCVDEKPADGTEFILKKELKLGSHGFTSGFNHPLMYHYGIRSIPSFWLLAPDGKIAISQFEFAAALRTRNDFSEIIADRIEGKDVPLPAAPAPESEKRDQN